MRSYGAKLLLQRVFVVGIFQYDLNSRYIYSKEKGLDFAGIDTYNLFASCAASSREFADALQQLAVQGRQKRANTPRKASE